MAEVMKFEDFKEAGSENATKVSVWYLCSALLSDSATATFAIKLKKRVNHRNL